MNDTEELFSLPAYKLFSETLVSMLRRDVDGDLTTEELRRRGYGFLLERLPDGRHEYTIFHHGQEVSMWDLVVDCAAEKFKTGFVRDCRKYNEREKESTA